VGCGDAGSGARVGDALADALMRAGGVVMLLVFGQCGAQVGLVQDQGPVEDSRRRVPMRRSQIAFIRGACTAVRTMVVPAAWKKASKDAVKVRSAVTDQEPEVPEPLDEVEGEVAGLLHCPVSGRVGGDAAEVHPAGAVLDEDQHSVESDCPV
jgi:hypothetical protein